MAIDKEFLDRLNREIASLKDRIESEQQEAARSQAAADANTLREAQARLRQLEETRERIIAQSSGG